MHLKEREKMEFYLINTLKDLIMAIGFPMELLLIHVSWTRQILLSLLLSVRYCARIMGRYKMDKAPLDIVEFYDLKGESHHKR